MAKPNEITEAVLKNRLLMALERDLSQLPLDAQVDAMYEDGKFKELVGIVGKATQEERTRAAHVARRKGHTETARLIADGK